MQKPLLASPLLAKFSEVRTTTEHICAPLLAEDYVVQPIGDVSPPKWHLGHTTWFFETFLLKQFLPDYQVFNKDFGFVFNSYYESVGARVIRTNRGNLSRPTTQEVYDYRKYVNEHMAHLLHLDGLPNALFQFLEIGLQHEQQHQELLYTDLKYILGNNPLFPIYQERAFAPSFSSPVEWLEVKEGLYSIGYEGDGFYWDNEKGVHKVYLEAFQARKSMVTNEEYLAFIEAGNYSGFEHWLSEGWEWVKNQQIKAPLYWYFIDGKWHEYTLYGMHPIDLHAPVTHLSFFEADAYASWSGHRLLTEFEWEVLAKTYSKDSQVQPNLVEEGWLHPRAAQGGNQLLGDCWEWTNSAYLPYPRYQKAAGALGEYNGKFMVNQMVLRGGSCITPISHIRLTYRNFFHTAARWQFTGIRLAKKA